MEEHTGKSAIEWSKVGKEEMLETTATTLGTLDDVIIDASKDDEALVMTKSDKAVCTNDTLEDLQRALTYEAVFSTLIENKMLAMKRDCEERKRIKRMKRKSIGRILFSKKLFGGSPRKSTSLGGIALNAETAPVTELNEGRVRKVSPQQSGYLKSEKSKETLQKASDDIEIASDSTASSQQAQRVKLKTGLIAVAPETPLAADDSLTSTFSNDNPSNSSADKNISVSKVKRSLLVKAQTHAPATAAEVVTSSSSGDSRDVATRLSANDTALPLSSLIDGISLASGYDNGGGAHLHTSTMADDSLTSIRDDSIESLSFASSRCTVSFGGTEVIPEDTASLLYERARTAKRLRILEAKSISAQCSPIFPRHEVKPLPQPLPPSPLTKIPVAAPIKLPPPITVANCIAQTQTQQRFLQSQASYTDSFGVGGLSDAALRFFSRQNTSEESANLTISTLLNEGDSLSLHAPILNSSGSGVSGVVSKKPFAITDRYKSKSTGLLIGNNNARSGVPPPTEQLQQLQISSNISNNGRLVVSLNNNSNNKTNIKNIDTNIVSNVELPQVAQQATTVSCTASSHYFPVISPSVSAIATSVNFVSSNGATKSTANGTIVTSGTVSANVAKLSRMTSTSTGSSVAPTGCCTTTKSSSRDKEKQRFKPSWPSGQTGSDDEYRRRKRKYKRYHRCSDPVLVFPTPSGLQHCILSMPPNDPIQFHYNEDFVYDMQLQVESDKNDDLQEIVPSNKSNRHRKHRHHKHKKRHRHKKPKILVHDLDTQVVKVIDPDDLPQRARWTIIATACLLLLMCLMLVGVTLRMAPIIDDMGERVVLTLSEWCSPKGMHNHM